MAEDDPNDVAWLREEVARLSAENDALRSRFRVAEPPREPVASARPTRVLLLPDPLAATEPGRPGPEAIAGLARTTISLLHERQPAVQWRAEHDLSRVPERAQCFDLGEVLRRLWDGTGPLPIAFEVEHRNDGTCSLRRCLLPGDSDSDRFLAGYDRQLRLVDDLLAEGVAAQAAGADHHASWALKAVDMVLARLAFALAAFRAGRADWRASLDAARPEYEPRYRIGAELPAGL